MMLSKLIDRAKKVKKEHGDMEVIAFVHYDEDCDKCGQSESRIKDGAVYDVRESDSGGNRFYFSIDAIAKI